jgi:uncharacterized protein (TIGR02569 family)
MDHARPPAIVIEAFGAVGRPRRLGGGRGGAWAVGGVVLKPADVGLPQLEWEAAVLPSMPTAEIRLAPPIRAVDGRFVVDGWSARPRLKGGHHPRRWREIVAVGDRLHGSFQGLRRPEFLAARTDPWAIADRVAWGEVPVGRYAASEIIRRLADARREVLAPDQLVHGDLTGNVLFASGLPPAVIDLSLYWRPAGYATAIVVVDALTWQGAPADLIDVGSVVHEFRQILVRALLFRAVTDCVVHRTAAELLPYGPVVDRVLALRS